MDVKETFLNCICKIHNFSIIEDIALETEYKMIHHGTHVFDGSIHYLIENYEYENFINLYKNNQLQNGIYDTQIKKTIINVNYDSFGNIIYKCRLPYKSK